MSRHIVDRIDAGDTRRIELAATGNIASLQITITEGGGHVASYTMADVAEEAGLYVLYHTFTQPGLATIVVVAANTLGHQEATTITIGERPPGDAVTLRTILDRAHRRTALLARRRDDATVAITEHDYESLEIWLREGIAEVARETKRVQGRQMWHLEPGETSAAVPAHMLRPLKVTIGADDWTREIGQLSGLEAELLLRYESTGLPTAYGIFGGRIYLNAAWDSPLTLTMTYFAGSLIEHEVNTPEAAFVLPDDPLDAYLVQDLPPEFARLLEDYVVAEWYDVIGETREAASARARYHETLPRVKGVKQKRRITTRPYRPFL